jgi:sortase A
VVGNESRLIIPKINVDVPVVYGLKSLDNDSTQKALENGVAHYPLNGANSLPGQTGNNVILGHSSNDVFAPGSYKFAFVLLERMEAGDLFYIHYKGKRYVYEVTAKQIIQPTQVNKLVTSYDKPLTTLVTCTPIGTDDKRLLVTAEQISPDPSEAERLQAPAEGGQDVSIPGNEPSLLQGLFNL